MAAGVSNEKIIINFGWIGPSSCFGGLSKGGSDVRVVNLIFKNAKTEISVHIPENFTTTTVRKLPFTCRKYHEKECEISGRKFKPLAQETHPELLKVTIEQIGNLTIQAGIFEQSPHKGNAIMDSLGKITMKKEF